MFNNHYIPEVNSGDTVAGARHKQDPAPSKEELLSRHSFPSPDQNRYIDALIKKTRH